MRSRTPPSLENRCPSCYLQLGFCICAQIPKVETRTRVVFVRHALERWKTTNTVRIAQLALPNAELWEYGGPEVRFDEAVLRRPDTWLLFPNGSETSAIATPPKRLVIVDGSWPQARKMVQKISAFREMPRLSLPAASTAPQRLRQPPHPEGRSTLEALADALTMLEGAEKGDPLHALHALMTQQVLDVRHSGGAILRTLGLLR